MLRIPLSVKAKVIWTLFEIPLVSLRYGFVLAVLGLLVTTDAKGQMDASTALNQRIRTHEQLLNNPKYYRDYPVGGFVRVMKKDHAGFMWIGAEPGLVRFDGKHFKKYAHDPKDSTSLSNDDIFSIWVDSLREEIWFGTGNGISVLNTKTDKFRRYQTSNSTLPDVYARCIYGDRQGRVWVGMKNGGFLEYDRTSDTFIQQFPKDTLNALPYRYTYIVTVLQDQRQDSILWLGSGYGLIRWNKETRAYQRFMYRDPTVSDNIHTLQNLYIDLYQHEDGKIYSANYRGINVFDPQTGNFDHIDPYGGQYGDDRARYRTRNIGRWSREELFVSLYNGFSVLDLKSSAIVKTWNNDPKQSYFNVLTRDEVGDWWGVCEMGLIRYASRNASVKYFQLPDGGRNTAIHRMVVLEGENDQTLYVGTQYNRGLLKLNLGDGSWRTIPPPPEIEKRESDFLIMDGDISPTGEIILAEFNRLFRYFTDAERLEEYPLQPQLDIAHYRSLLVRRNGEIWAGTQSHGLIRILPGRDTFLIYQDELSPAENPAHFNNIWALYEDRVGNIWIRAKRGYSIYSTQRDTFFNFVQSDNADAAFLSHRSFVEDDLGRVWLTGDDEGVGINLAGSIHSAMDTLPFADRKDLSFFGEIEKDAHGFIWLNVGTRGWLKINPQTLDTQLIPNEWLSGRSVKSLERLSNGRMAVGYNEVLAIFDENDFPEVGEIPKPYLNELLLYNEPFKLDSSLLHTRFIRLRHHENFLTFRFGAVAYYDAEFTQLSYRLLGAHEEWFEPNEVWQASYSSLAPGDYLLEIKAENNAGISNGKPYQLQIRIEPPWWKSYWAYAAYLFLFLGVLYAFYRFQLHRKLALAEAARLQEMNRFKSRMFTNITHEFRTPLTIIMGMADEILRDSRFRLGERVRLIRRNGDQLLDLINQLLDLRKLETGHLQLQPEPGDLAKYLNYLVESFQSMAAIKHIRLVYYADPDSLPMLFDEEKIKRVVSNLLANAIKFTPEYGKITIGVAKAGASTVVIKVKDTGLGIPEDQLDYIFDRFYQGDATTTRKEEGTGIGLALTRELVQLMNGEIAVESKVDVGTAFTIRLPYDTSPKVVSKAYEVSRGYTPLKKMPTQVLSGGPVVLIVEDNQDVIYYLQSFLGDAYRVEKAFNGKEGIEKAQELIPDIIISDVMMPEINGLEMVAQLKRNERTSHIPIIMLTARVTQRDKEEGLNVGADAYLAKPFQKEELLIRIQRLLESRRRLQEKYAGNIGLEEFKDADGEEAAFLLRLNRTIEENFSDENFKVRDLCRAMGMSRTQLHRKITALTNKSTSEWIRWVRLHKAKALLLHTDWPIAEIADRVGFKAPSHFTKVFRQTFEVLPSALRKAGGEKLLE